MQEDNQVMRDEFEKWAEHNLRKNGRGAYYVDDPYIVWQAALKQPNNNPEAKEEL